MVNRRGWWLTLVGAVGMTGCAAIDPGNPRTTAPVRIHYMKDERTGLCFATAFSSTSYGYRVASIAAVPCEPVMGMLGR